MLMHRLNEGRNSYILKNLLVAVLMNVTVKEVVPF